MQGTKNVRFEDVENLMERMMGVPIFRNSENRGVSSPSGDSNGVDPNLIMDLRHRTIGEPFPVSATKSVLLAEVTRMLMDEETRALYRKREEETFESELRKFESGLCNSRPRFRGPYSCTGKRDAFQNSDNYDRLWKTAPRRVKVKVKDNVEIGDSQTEGSERRDDSFAGSIKVTIKDKSTSECKEREHEILKATFEMLLSYAKEERRKRDSRMKIQERVASRRLRKYFEIWKNQTENRRERNKEIPIREMSDERKIELFVNAINEKQKKLGKNKKYAPTGLATDIANETKGPEERAISAGAKNSAVRTIIRIVGSPAQNRLNAQKKIIAEQKTKLARQNRIIEELRLRQIEDETRKAGRETTSAAREALVHCARSKTRTSLMRLMAEEEGGRRRDKTSLAVISRLPSPPKFLARMEARAEARRERARRTEEDRKRKLEEQRLKEQAARREEEENEKRLRLEAQREARRIRVEQERKRAREIERSRAMNELAEKFYRKYLLRHYAMEPFALLVEMKHNRTKTAADHYEKNLLRKIVAAWKTEMENQRRIKFELASSMWRRNLLWYSFRDWRESAKCESRKFQVAADFYELRLVERCLRTWNARTVEAKIKDFENERSAIAHVEARSMVKCFRNWRKYVEIADEVKETDRRRNKWRELVQRVVPDFDPKQRGVIIDD